MSKVTRVTVLCPNGRRQIVNLSPNYSILQILEEVCKKQNLNPDDFDICHFNKPMDLTVPVRFSHLSNNAQLELQPVKNARKECLVTVGLQLESGERIMNDFVPSTSIADIVEQCLMNKPNREELNLKGEPVCIYMRQTLVGNALKETTLRGLGLTKGSAIIRLIYRNPEDLSDQAHVSMPLSKPLKTESPEHFSTNMLPNSVSKMEHDSDGRKPSTYNASSSIETSNISSVSMLIQKAPVDKVEEIKQMNSVKQEKEVDFSTLQNVEDNKVHASDIKTNFQNQVNETVPKELENQKMELEYENMDEDSSEEEIGAIHYIGSRHAVLYSLNDITNVKKADLPDEFFALTVDDAKYLMEEFKRTRQEMENQPLLTKELRERQLLQKLGRFKKTVIRVYFPERLVLQAVFEAQETVQEVLNFVRNFLEDRELNFYLYTAPPKEKKDPSKTLIESMLIPAAVVYFGCDKQKESYLLNSLKDKISDPRAATLAASESRKEAICEEEETSIELDEIPSSVVQIAEDYRAPGPSSSQPSCSVQTSEKVPKWLKLSKK